MRNSIGGLWIMGIMLVFIAIFITFVCIQFNYNHVYMLKSDAVTVIEEYQGMTTSALSEIDGLISKYGYKKKIKCTIPEEHIVYGVINGVKEVANNKNKEYEYCFYVEEHAKDKDTLGGSLEKFYYTVEFAFGFALPGFGDIYNFKVYGETNAIMYPADDVPKEYVYIEKTN